MEIEIRRARKAHPFIHALGYLHQVSGVQGEKRGFGAARPFDAFMHKGTGDALPARLRSHCQQTHFRPFKGSRRRFAVGKKVPAG